MASLPPIYGLYAATVAGYVYSLFGTSGQLTLGPVALVRGHRHTHTYIESLCVDPKCGSVAGSDGLCVSYVLLCGV
jgi:MFS superfamily sulfate permease-like transporter